MSLGSFVFFLWFIPSLVGLYLFTSTKNSKRWLGLLALNLIFISLRGIYGLIFVLSLSAFIFWAASAIRNLKNKDLIKEAQRLYWITVCISLLAWVLVKLQTVNSLELSASYISFFLLAYLTEVYWGRLPPVQKFAFFASAGTSLSYISSGPVPLPGLLIQQIKNPLPLTAEIFRESFFRIFLGLAKKALADVILFWIIFAKSSSSNMDGAAFAWIIELLRGAQLYADFSGYADIAIGVGLLLGHRLPENFNLPFLSTSVGSYWRRWNSSVTTWFLTYIFTPLSLRLRGLARSPYRFMLGLPGIISTYLTLLLVGLWHGFNWMQIIWSFLVASLIVFENLFSIERHLTKTRIGTFIAWGLTFYFMAIARIFSTEIISSEVFNLIKKLHTSTKVPLNSQHVFWLFFASLAIVVPHFMDYLRFKSPKIFLTSWMWAVSMVIFGVLIILFYDTGQPFIYEGI